MDLRDRVVVITGSGNGIGEACARRFAVEGAKVVVTDIEADSARRVADEIGAPFEPGDITQEATVKAVADKAREAHGRIDIWFSNAGLAGPREPGQLQSDAQWDRAWRLNVMSHVFAAREVLPEMIERGEGYLIQTASLVALSMQMDKVSYSVTKHAALHLSEWLAATYRPRGIRVSCFCPGAMDTRMFRANNLPDDHPAVRMALKPEQVADLLVRGITAESFLILDDGPADSAPLLKGRAEDYEGWLNSQKPVGLF
jgi:NAD(P)-dependent dehydrogenase (short-subunit alcohol dehydrogenase family)